MLDRSGSLDRVDQYVRTGKLHEAREELLRLPEADLAILRAQLGDRDVTLLFRSAQRARGHKSKGKVVLIHGITGSELGSVDAGGDEDGVWMNVVRLMRGRLARLALGVDGKATSKDWSIRATGHLKRYYLPMLLHLNQHWETRAFSYDWRLDIDHAADALAQFIQEFGKGEPVHVVAHSMGGLVTRRFLQRHGKVWASMRDPNGLASGGRLVMLGTPNHGSFAIPLTLTGAEKTVKMLAAIDLHHDFDEILAILDVWPGSYQMLPSHLVDLGDAHARLYERNEWGQFPVHASLLKRARTFHDELATAVDTERMRYVAGYDRETPDGIQIAGPGKFTYRRTMDGDGRVPHSLGLLAGVPTYYVDESHGDLARSASVMHAIDALLETGATAALPSIRPPSATRGPQRAEFVDAAAIEVLPHEFAEFSARFSGVRGKRSSKNGAEPEAPPLSEAEQARLESIVLSEYLGRPKDVARRNVNGGAARKLPIEVVWGDITQIDADVFAVGHYVGVEPINAERALERVIGASDANGKPGVLTEWIRRGALVGRHGDIDFFPWGDGSARMVAVVGMGHPGTFGRTRLRSAVRDLYWRVASLPGKTRLCMVLIGSGSGSGEGALDYRSALENVLVGLGDALRSDYGNGLAKVSLVELERHKAFSIHKHLTRILDDRPGEHDVALKDSVVRGKGAVVASGDGLASVLAAAALACESGDEHGKAIEKLMSAFPDADGGVRTAARNALAEIARQASTDESNGKLRAGNGKRATSRGAKTGSHAYESIASRLEVRIGPASERARVMPTRIWFHKEDDSKYCCGAITDTAVVPQRELKFDPKTVGELVDKVTAAGRLDALELDVEQELSSLVHRLMVHRDLRDLLRDMPSLVIEVDRATAPIHWELLPPDEQDRRSEPIAIHVPLARQLKTTYSPPPSAPRARGQKLRALVVGDPGDPRAGMDLPGARREALRIAEILRERDVDVHLMLGSPSARERGSHALKPAGRLEVLHELMKGGWDILHYAGHCDFDPADPSRFGWVFETGPLTSGELARVDLAPPLVVANACLSVRTSDMLASRGSASAKLREADLVPSLADEFFHRGVRNYIGTAWEVNDIGAVTFAETLYTELLGPKSTNGDANSGATLGKALCEARKALYAQREQFALLWAAYQHYGDPNYRVRE